MLRDGRVVREHDSAGMAGRPGVLLAKRALGVLLREGAFATLVGCLESFPMDLSLNRVARPRAQSSARSPALPPPRARILQYPKVVL